MNSWIDDILTREDTWLVLVFHGIEGIGWEAIPKERIKSYFEYIGSKSSDIWVGTFAEVTQYMRQRMATNVVMKVNGNSQIEISLISELDPYWYNQDLSLKTYLPKNWNKIEIAQNDHSGILEIQTDDNGRFVAYNANSQKGKIVLKNITD
jgi:hypothetical protein